MKLFPLALVCLCALPKLLLADADTGRALVAAKAINAFAAAHQRLQPPGNALTSPLSIEMNMAMVYAGAGGGTRDALAKALFLPADEKALHDGFESLRKSLVIKPSLGELRLANRVFYDRTMKVQAPWLELTRNSYGAEAGALDFVKHTTSAVGTINQWVSDQTSKKIANIIPERALSSTTRMVLVDAAYFGQPWEERFRKELTQIERFYIDPAHAKQAPLMFKQHRLGYARKDGLQIAALRYAGGMFQLVVLLPDAIDGLPKVEQAITGELLTECSHLETSEVRLSFPRLRLSLPIVPLRESLTAMGAGLLFDPVRADFSRMSPAGLFVNEVYHRTFLELDEDGTKAGAATAVQLRKSEDPSEEPHVVKADHPFLYMIQHIPTGACLFLGRLVDPAPGTAPENAVPPVVAAPSEKKN
ncbi:MAG TPA: serpin family protein [Chthoniobacteraceae bacterium]|jgi:serpin B|nr:serpin family protein [Chthoniobacteraceae bacterium]